MHELEKMDQIKSEIKVIVCDLDETLLNQKRTLSAYTIQVLQTLREKGYQIYYDTARSYPACKRIMNIFEPDVLICNGGALVLKKGQTIYKKELEQGFVDRVIRAYQNLGLDCHMSIENESGFFHNFSLKDFDSDYHYGQHTNFQEYCVDQNAYKISVMADDEIIQSLNIQDENVKCLKFSHSNMNRFSHKDATKKQGLLVALQHEHHSIEEVIAFGDDYGDMEMIQAARMGVAMENSAKDVKDISDAICGHHDEDGVAKWLSANLL